MKIVDFVRQDLIVPNLKGRQKVEVLQELAGHLSQSLEGVDHQTLVGVLLDREKLASTAIGDGIAIPHGKMESVRELVACIGRSAVGVDFDSMDGRKTHLFFVLLAPENSTGIHLKALARISRLFKDGDFRKRLLEAGTVEELYQIIVEEDAKY